MAMSTKGFSHYDTADYLAGEEDIKAYLDACSEEGDPALMAAALDVVARARNKEKLMPDVEITSEVQQLGSD